MFSKVSETIALHTRFRSMIPSIGKAYVLWSVMSPTFMWTMPTKNESDFPHNISNSVMPSPRTTMNTDFLYVYVMWMTYVFDFLRTHYASEKNISHIIVGIKT